MKAIGFAFRFVIYCSFCRHHHHNAVGTANARIGINAGSLRAPQNLAGRIAWMT